MTDESKDQATIDSFETEDVSDGDGTEEDTDTANTTPNDTDPTDADESSPNSSTEMSDVSDTSAGSEQEPSTAVEPAIEAIQTETDPQLLATASEQVGNVTRLIVGSQEETEPGTLPGLAGRLMEQAGSYPGKYDPPIALSTHVINTIVTGTTAYVYDRVVKQEGEVDTEELRLLVAGLALHDANKYVEAAYDVDFGTRTNTEQVLNYYFEQGDDFGLTQVLPGETEDDLSLDIADVKWLVQRTETKDTTSGTRGESTQRVRGLERYCRIGDGFVSKVHADSLAASAEWLESMLGGNSDDTSHVHQLSFSNLEQSVLNDHLIEVVKDVIRGEIGDDTQSPPPRGVILGSTAESIVYLGDAMERSELKQWLEARFMSRITDSDDPIGHSFDAKTQWNSFEYNILNEIDIPFESKRAIIAEGYATEIARGAGGTGHEFEQVPEAFKDHLPELAKVVFMDKNCPEDLADYPALERLWNQVEESENYNAQSKKIGFFAELLRRFNGSVDDGYDHETIKSEVAALREDNQEALREDLAVETDTGSLVIDRFFEGGVTNDLELPSGDEMCFLCGRPAQQDYKKGTNAFYGTQSFSKRVSAEGDYKKICPVCNLEHALLRDTIEGFDYGVDKSIKIAFVYYDDFLADIGVRGSADPTGLIRALQDDQDDDEVQANLADPELVASSFGRQYHLQPLYIDDENARLRQIRALLGSLVQHGFKIVIGKPFAGFRPQDALLADLDATRRQVSYGADRIETYEQLERVIRLFDILGEVADSSDYRGGRELTQLPQDGFYAIADLVARESEYGYEVRSLAHEHFINTQQHKEQYMQMRDVAQAGLDLYNREYGSRHKKTKIFRRAVDATLDGLNRDMDDDQLFEHVTGQVYKVATADAPEDHFVQPDQAEAFVQALFDLLRDNDGLNKSSLSQRRNTLSNTYLYAYDQLLKELSEDSDSDDDTEQSEEETPA